MLALIGFFGPTEFSTCTAQATVCDMSSCLSNTSNELCKSFPGSHIAIHIAAGVTVLIVALFSVEACAGLLCCMKQP